jgi:serine/threonine kinase 3
MENGPENYTLQEKLGEGSFGKVYKALEIPTGRTVAVKIVPVEQDTGEVAREIEMLKTCNSANIVRYYNSFTRGSELWIVMEFCAGSSLGDIMEARSRCLTEGQIAAVLAGTLAGLAYLHDLNKIHRDIKAGNLLLTDKGQVKLADFGVSAQVCGRMPAATSDRSLLIDVESRLQTSGGAKPESAVSLQSRRECVKPPALSPRQSLSGSESQL